MQAAEANCELDRAVAAGEGLGLVVALFDRLSGFYNEAKGSVRHALAAATSASHLHLPLSRTYAPCRMSHQGHGVLTLL